MSGNGKKSDSIFGPGAQDALKEYTDKIAKDKERAKERQKEQGFQIAENGAKKFDAQQLALGPTRKAREPQKPNT